MKSAGALSFILIFLLVGLTGCNNGAAVIKEVNSQELSKAAQTFVDTIQDKSGLYLYSPVGEKQYLIVNNSKVSQGEEAKFLNSVTAEVLDQTLNINIEEQGTLDYGDKRLEGVRIFNLGSGQDYEKIRVYKNETETVFDSVSG